MKTDDIRIEPTYRSVATGTGLVGYLPEGLGIRRIAAAVGAQPHRLGDTDGKVTRQWVLRVGGTVVTIYDYKGHRWHVGGCLLGARVLAERLGVELKEA